MTTENEDVKLPSKEELLGEIDQTTTPKTEETPKFSERETQALNFGWKPKDKWVEEGGDPEDWRPAKDFLERGEMIGKIRALTKETQEIQRALRHTMDQNTKVYERGYAAAVTELQAQRRAALSEGDVLKADDIQQKIDTAKDELERVKAQAAPPKANQPDPEHLAWVQENPWYNDRVMQKFADALAIEYVAETRGQATPDEVRKFVATTVRKEFAHRLEPKKVTAAPNPDSSGSQGNSGGGGKGLSPSLAKIESEMTEEQRSIMRTLLRQDKTFTKEEYLKQYAASIR